MPGTEAALGPRIKGKEGQDPMCLASPGLILKIAGADETRA